MDGEESWKLSERFQEEQVDNKTNIFAAANTGNMPYIYY